MLKFFGISKKDKISVKDTASIFSVALNKVINDGFSEIQDFLNKNNNLESSPNISENDVKWFRLIIFVGNIHILSTKIDEENSLVLRNLILDNLLPYLNDDDEIALDLYLNYEKYFDDIVLKHNDTIESMTIAVFDKFNINRFQSELFRKKDEPNPILFNELRKYIGHFVWNWEEFLEKCKITF
mgnify:CR=1 FL=1